jgi:hypothetical protein
MSTQTVLYQSDHLRAVMFGPMSGRLIVTFDHWSRGKNDFGTSQHARFWAKNDVSQLSVKTKRNDWFVNPDTGQLEEVLRKAVENFDHVNALGFSMGAYGALRLSKALGADHMVLVSPQFSVWADHAPDSQWWKRYEGALGPVDGALKDHGRASQKGDLIFDPFDPEDAYHARLCLHSFPSLIPVPLPFAGHPAHQAMSESGQFRPFQKAAMAKTSMRGHILTKFKTIRRTSDRYQQNLARYLKARRARGETEKGHPVR